MKRIHQIPESSMVAAFIAAELTSERFSAALKQQASELAIDERILIEPDIHNEVQNLQRAELLGKHHGYKQNRDVFEDFPDRVIWYEASLDRQEIGALQYIDYDYWNELTDNTHLVKDAVKNIRNGKVVFGVSNDRFYNLADKIRQDGKDLDPIILYTTALDLSPTILEGHLRATAFGLAGDKAPPILRVILGVVA